jgi:hypothetical protein
MATRCIPAAGCCIEGRNCMCKTDFHGTLILSKIIDLDYVKEKIKAGLGCGIRLVSSNPTSYKIDFKGSGNCREDVIQDFLDEITPFTISGYILYRMENGMKWRHCFNTNCQEWVEESLEYRRSINGKKEAKAELMEMLGYGFPRSNEVIIIDSAAEFTMLEVALNEARKKSDDKEETWVFMPFVMPLSPFPNPSIRKPSFKE